MAAKTAQEVFNAKMAQRLSTVVFPMDKMPEGIKEVFHKALKWNSIRRIGAHEMSWSAFIRWQRPFFVGEISLIIDILKAATPIEMEQTLEENLEMCETILNQLITAYNEIYEEERVPIEREVNALFKISKGVPLGKQIIQQH